MGSRLPMREWEVVIIMLLITIIGVRATAPVRLAHTDCQPANLSAKCRIAPR